MCLIFILPLSCFGVYAENDGVMTLAAKSAVLMDASTGKVLYAVNENDRLYPASVTKIMPLLLFMEALDEGRLNLDDKVTASADAAGKGGSQIWLKEGETMTVDELLRATAIASANDACTALGEHLCGSEAAFVSRMNERAKQLGMLNTNFVNCSGLDDDTTEHLTTALDVAVMSKELLSHEKIRDYTTVWMDTLRNGETQLTNTNRLVRFYEGTTGLKTGTTAKAGHCLSASAERDGIHLIAVIMGAANSTERFEGAKSLLNWGFANYETFTPEIKKLEIGDVIVLDGINETITPYVGETESLTLKKGMKEKLEYTVELAADVQAPVEKGQLLGKVTGKIGDEVVCEYPLTSENAVRKITLCDVIGIFLKSMTKSA